VQPRSRLSDRKAAQRARRFLRVQLTDTHLEELDGALAGGASWDDVLDITRESFPLPTLGGAQGSRELINGRGSCPSAAAGQKLRQGRAPSIYWGIGTHPGNWPQNAKGICSAT
jgi:hypothetical protein